MDSSVQVQLDKIKVDIKTLMSAVKKIVLEKRETDKNVERLDADMKKLRTEKELSRETEEIEQNLQHLHSSNSDLNLVVNNVSEKLKQVDSQVTSHGELIKNIDICMNNTKEKVSQISSKEPVEIREFKSKLKLLDDKIESYDREIREIETKINEKKAKSMENPVKNLISNKSCQYCGITLETNYELEMHLVTHQEATKFECDNCGQSFFSKWRLKKHVEGHQKQRRCCHYFNNKKECPFEKIGCKFNHIPSNNCKFGSQCERPKCQYKHQDSLQIASNIS